MCVALDASREYVTSYGRLLFLGICDLNLNRWMLGVQLRVHFDPRRGAPGTHEAFAIMRLDAIVPDEDDDVRETVQWEPLARVLELCFGRRITGLVTPGNRVKLVEILMVLRLLGEAVVRRQHVAGEQDLTLVEYRIQLTKVVFFELFVDGGVGHLGFSWDTSVCVHFLVGDHWVLAPASPSESPSKESGV